ncbi:iron-sulfur cluster insertion protein ErpA [Candidatus Sneabacter namystus]|uniref:Iron-sulfur cluster insertion protein ErpA n=1 Tax=Candidatus Sneabacter namystus TaxID=2601646 RepID=A0A5C0UHT8_9RICK|nr:iron-sulfur cluster insertion protein ErpA [Candidatus Sneabacter namystus]QEK39616.1 iron-sulfur cluster insertion protein ErpA [Candidatus Sneabacter namystus]
MLITQQAIERIKKLLELENEKDLKLRISVDSGGCAGLQYSFEFTQLSTSDDVVVSKDNITVIIDSISYKFIQGSTLDFIKNVKGAFFKIVNPNAQSGCGCGNSFSI